MGEDEINALTLPCHDHGRPRCDSYRICSPSSNSHKSGIDGLRRIPGWRMHDLPSDKEQFGWNPGHNGPRYRSLCFSTRSLQKRITHQHHNDLSRALARRRTDKGPRGLFWLAQSEQITTARTTCAPLVKKAERLSEAFGLFHEFGLMKSCRSPNPEDPQLRLQAGFAKMSDTMPEYHPKLSVKVSSRKPTGSPGFETKLSFATSAGLPSFSPGV